MAYRSQAGQATLNIRDALLKVTVALPNAGATANTNGIDLGALVPYPVTENIQVEVVTAASTAANNKNINFVLQDSADNTTFANIGNLGAPLAIVTGNTTAHAATTHVYQLPPVTLRYIRASATGESNGGDASDGNITVTILL